MRYGLGLAFLGGFFEFFHLLWNIRLLDNFFCPWLFAFLMTRKQFQGRKPYNYLASFLLFQCRSKESFHGQWVKPIEKKEIKRGIRCVVRYGGEKDATTKTSA